MRKQNGAPGGSKRLTALFCQALLVFSPFLLIGALSLYLGRNALLAWPVWTDELDYWRALYNWDAVGFATGYSGMLEVLPQAGTLSVHGVTPILLYGWFVKLFGLTPYTIVICNAVWVSVGALAFCLLIKPKPWVSLVLTLLTVTYVPAVLYISTSMTEVFNYSLLMMYAALLYRFSGSRKWVYGALAGLCVAFGCLYRINLFLLFFPLAWIAGDRRFTWKTWAYALGGIVLAGGLYLLSSAYTAPYVQGFLYNFMNMKDPATAFQMLLSHGKQNIINYLTFYKVEPVEWDFRVLYMASMGLCLIGSFFRVEREKNGLRPRLEWNPLYIWCFLWMAGSLAIVLALYEVMNWADFRTLAPVCWLVPAYLFLRGKKAVPGAMLAGSLALLILLCCAEPVGIFADQNRYDPPARRDNLHGALGCIAYDPAADDPFQNTVRTDLNGERLLMELDPGLGLEFGWLTEDSVGKSRWILTDTLKIPLAGYQQVYSSHDAVVFRREEP